MQDQVFSLVPQAANLADLIGKAKTFVASAKAPATLKAYRNDWNDFQSWCQSHQLPSLPSAPDTVALYIADRASTLAAGTITRRLTSITKAHRAAGYNDSPATTKHFIVGETLAGIRRVLGTAQHGKDPLLAEDICKILAACPDSMLGDPVWTKCVRLICRRHADAREQLVNGSPAPRVRSGCVVLRAG